MTALTYSRYLHLKELLSLQQPLTPDNQQDVRDSERLFITVHQASETLLSQALADLRHISENRCAGNCFHHRAERVTRLIHTLEGHLRLLRDTLRREDFLEFRERLGTASGLQSAQFHELFAVTAELTSGPSADRMPQRRGEFERLHAAVQRWRQAHLELVDHMIGGRPGTANTSGARFLADELATFASGAGGFCPVGNHHATDADNSTSAPGKDVPERDRPERDMADSDGPPATSAMPAEAHRDKPAPAAASASASASRDSLGRVVVLGGGVAGLLTAHVLADHTDRVTVLERDHPGDDEGPRAGVPQSKHTHVLLTSGIRALDELLPGLLTELTGAGAPCLSIPAEVGVWQAGQWVSRRNPSHPVLTPSRPFLEGHLRRAVLANPRIELVSSVEVAGLLGTPQRITGVRTRERGNAVKGGRGGRGVTGRGETREFAADLVVDATGRGSQTSRWLAELGAPQPAEEIVETGRAYATCVFQSDERLGNDLRGFYIVPDAGQPLGTIVLPAEDDRWMVTLSGPKGQEPPTELAGFVDFASGLPHDAPHKWLSTATALGRPVGYRHTGNRRRRYDRTARGQQGLLVVGDAVCALNPVYGQGLSVAALNAVALRRTLAAARGRTSTHALQRAVLRSSESAWAVATGADSPMPGASGNAVRTGVVPRLLDWYLERVREHVPGDPVVCSAFRDVLFLLAPPRSLLTSAQVIRRSLLRRPATTPPDLPTP